MLTKEERRRSMEKALQKQKEMRAAGVIIRHKTKQEKWIEKDTPRSAIDAYCEKCMGGPDGEGHRQDIRDCSCGPNSSLPCPLWAWRPYK